jgi:uncharacterized protein (DUF2062 family)
MRVFSLLILTLIFMPNLAFAAFVMPQGAPQIAVSEHSKQYDIVEGYKEQITLLDEDSAEYTDALSSLTDALDRLDAIEDLISNSGFEENADRFEEDDYKDFQALQEDIFMTELQILDASDPLELSNLGKKLEFHVGERTTFLEIRDSENPAFDFSDIEREGGSTSAPPEARRFFSNFISSLQKHVYTFVVVHVYTDLAKETGFLFKVFAGFWLLWVIVNTFFMQAQTNPSHIVVQFILMCAASFMLSSEGVGVFVEYFYNPITSMFYYLSNFFMEKATVGLPSASSSGMRFDSALLELEKLFNVSFEMSAHILDNTMSSRWDVSGFFKGLFISTVFVGAVSALVFLFCAYWSYAIFALHVLLAVTPIMMMLGVFKKTRQYTFKWFSGCVNYLMIPVVLSISMGITIMILNEYYTSLINDTADTVLSGSKIQDEDKENIFNIILICFLSFLVHLRVGEISAFLTGGLSNGLSSTWALGMMAVGKGLDIAKNTPRAAMGAGQAGAKGIAKGAELARNLRK